MTFADDVTANLHAPHASSGEMRLRCSPEFGVARAYGGIAEVVGGDGVYRVGGRHAHTAAAFDFEFETSAGFGYDYESLPTLQLAYYYAAYLPIDEDEEPSEEGEEGGEGGGSPSSSPGRGIARRWRLVRRLRVSTLQLQVARGARHLYESANGAECVALLTQKVLCAAVDEGFREARLLLQDWLVVVLGKYHRMYGAHADRIGDPDALCRSLRQIPRWVFALLRGPLLSSNTPLSPHALRADARAALLASYATLPPRRLLTAIYPALYCYHSADKVASSEPLPLSWAALPRARRPLPPRRTAVSTSTSAPMTTAAAAAAAAAVVMGRRRGGRRGGRRRDRARRSIRRARPRRRASCSAAAAPPRAPPSKVTSSRTQRAGSERFSLSFLEFVGRETRGYLRDTGRTAEDFESFDTDSRLVRPGDSFWRNPNADKHAHLYPLPHLTSSISFPVGRLRELFDPLRPHGWQLRLRHRHLRHRRHLRRHLAAAAAADSRRAAARRPRTGPSRRRCCASGPDAAAAAAVAAAVVAALGAAAPEALGAAAEGAPGRAGRFGPPTTPPSSSARAWSRRRGLPPSALSASRPS